MTKPTPETRITGRKILCLPDAHLHIPLIEKVDSLLEAHPDWECVSLGDWCDDWGRLVKDYQAFFDVFLPFCQKYKERLHLCWGNHDYGYWVNSEHHSGYMHDAKDIVRHSLTLMQTILPIKIVQAIDGVLFSHAGICQRWFEVYKSLLPTLPDQSLLDYTEQVLPKLYLDPHWAGSPLWRRPTYTPADTFNPQILQVVGHTYVDSVHHQADSNIVYTDTWSTDSEYFPLGDNSLCVIDTKAQKIDRVLYADE